MNRVNFNRLYFVWGLTMALLLNASITMAQDDDLELPKIDVDTVSKLKSTQNDSRYPYQTTPTQGSLNLKMPANYNQSVDYDPETKEYIFKEKIGNYDYRQPYSMSTQEYKKYDLKKSTLDYWVTKRQTDKGDLRSSFLPSLNLGGAAFDNIFGSNAISIVPQGSAELIFGLNTSKINNPNISENLRKTTTFDFQQKIQMNVTGSIGDKVKLGVKYNTEATFEFENQTKLEYAGKEDDIIRKIEFGNVTMPLSGSLITGSQSLFGIKTELQFGKLNITTVVSQQKGESSSITAKGGAQVSEFDIACDQYEANKHFFLDLFFRNHYEGALQRLPLISSGIAITKIEVWVTNKNNQTSSTRNLAAFLELGSDGTTPPKNDSTGNNSVYSLASKIRDVSTMSSILTSSSYTSAKVENARMLSSSEYTLNANLGYISLSSALNSDEVLAVAYSYTYMGRTYQVGEFSSKLAAPNSLLVKLIKGKSLSPKNKHMWSLMMKNIYSLNAYQLNQKNFRLNVMYLDDKNGVNVNYIPADSTTRKVRLLTILKLDQINSNSDRGSDGVFDFVNGITVNAANGRVIFPTLEPFNQTIRNYLDSAGKSETVIKKYTYPQLYDSTITKARLFSEKNKYRLKGTYESQSGSEISLNATNLTQGSVVVTAGGRKLTENVDYTVDYTLGRVKIINQGLLESQQDITVSLESNALYNFQTKTLVGTHLDYKFSDNLHLGGTIEHLSERPMTSKVNIGDEPISNTIWGLNGSYTTKSQFLTTMLDKIPFLDVKDPSVITIDGEFAQLIPGHSKSIGKNGEAYIDDFEGAESAIDLRTPQSWFLASTPKDLRTTTTSDPLAVGYKRAKLAWYTIDPLFLRKLSTTPSHIKNNANAKSSNFVREIEEKEIFKNKDVTVNEISTISVLNLAYYPSERGPYNYDATDVNSNGTLKTPENRWGGIMRELPTTDFEAANIGFIEFWMMDPFVEDSAKTNKGGKLIFNLGDVSEDVLPDSRKSFEDGLPSGTSTDSTQVDSTDWGNVPPQSATSLFSFSGNAQNAQDAGLDGLKGDKERNFTPFKTFLNRIQTVVETSAYNKLYEDPSSDNFHYYRGSDYDAEQLGILQRYKNYNGMDGNSPVLTTSGTAYSGTNTPNTEDINKDNTLDEDENYYQYKVDITPDKLKIGSNFIVDSVSNNVTFANGKKSTVSWFQFRIPITEYEKTVGSIEDFQSIRFMRMFMNNFSDSVILRFARLQLVRGEWRKYNLSFRTGGESVTVPQDDDASLELSTVNIEDNASKKPVNYVLPPGVSRQVDPSNPQLSMLNEQSLVMKVTDLPTGDARVAYKTVTMDMRRYKKLKMFVHAEQMTSGTDLKDDDLRLFIRMGSDSKSNFYEYEIPLKLTPWGTYTDSKDADKLSVWPTDNTLDILLEDFQQAKQARNDEIRTNSLVTTSTVFPYTITDQKGIYYICGSPSLSNIRTIMVGIRKPYDAKKVGQTSSAEIWINELRLTDFDESGGWAANLNVNTKLSDFGSVSMAGSIKTAGFGSIDQTIGERSTENIHQFDVGANLEMGKFLPEKSGIQIPMYVGYSQSVSNPEYNPLDPDILLSTTLKNAATEAERDSIRKIVQTVNIKKSINFTNVKINKKEGAPRIYDISNWSASYSYSNSYYRDISTQYDEEKLYKGGIMYTYQLKPKNVTPLNNISVLRPNYMRLIRDFNFFYLPSNIGFRSDMTRTYNETLLRNVEDPDMTFTPTVSKDFLWNRNYDLAFDLSKSLKLDFSATNVSRIQEPAGVVDRSDAETYNIWRNEVIKSIKNGGDNKHYQHDINLSYTIPINKLPGLGWTSANARYNGTYTWDRAPIGLDSIGNTINNSNSLQGSGQLNFTTLYNQVPYFKRILQPKPPKAQQKKKYKTIVFEKEKVFFKANEPKVIMHKLKTEDVKLKVLAADGKEIKGKTEVVNENKVNFTADADYKDAKVSVEGKVEEKPNPFVFVLENGTRLMLSVKNVSISWTRTQGMTVTGFMKSTKYMGMADDHLNAPGIPFVLGYQDVNFMQKAIDNKWLSTDISISTPSTMTYSESLNLRANLEPIPSLKIELFASRTFGKNNSAYYSLDTINHVISASSKTETGNVSISVLSLNSSFEKLKAKDNYDSKVFQKFLNYRALIARKLAQKRKGENSNYNPDSLATTDGGKNGYSLTSQNVLIPAFMAAYCDKGGNVNTNRIPTILDILPNWRVTYDGLSKLELVKRYAKTVTLNHYYKSTYTIGSYVSNQDYDLEAVLSEARDLANNFIPRLDVSSVSLKEQFGPLVGVSVTFLNDISTSFEMRKDRNVVLSLTNNQVTDNNSNEWVFGIGYKFKAPGFIIRTAQSTARPDKNDINLRGDFSIRDNKTIIRKITDTEDRSQASSGQNILTMKISADYDLSTNFNVRLFYDLIVNNPIVSTSYPTSNSNVGFSVKFSLAQ